MQKENKKRESSREKERAGRERGSREARDM